MEFTNKKLIYLAIICGTLAFFINLFFVLHYKSEAEGGSRKFVVAAKTIGFGDNIGPNDFTVVRVPQETSNRIQNRYLSETQFLREKERIAQRDIFLGEFISKDALGLVAADFDPKDLSNDERAVSIRVDEESSIGYRLSRGNKIDIYQVIDGNIAFSMTNVQVAAVGLENARSSSSSSNYRTIVLRVSNNQAEEIIKAKGRRGDFFQIALRRPDK